VSDELLHQRGATLVRRQRLAPGEATPWHRDPHHRISIVLRGESLAIEFRDGAPAESQSLHPGQCDWEEPCQRIHRAVNTGAGEYEEVTIFLLDAPGADPQPRGDEPEERCP
jgi:quercetin dioxygenase-like cupin family protein